MWNVLSLKPFKDEALGDENEFAVFANVSGQAKAVVNLNKRPGEIFLLDYHVDGKLKGIPGKTKFGGNLYAKFPKLN